MGVTTLVLGNCGSSKLDIGEFFGRMNQVGFSPNISSLIGHGTVRNQVMGKSFRRPPTAKELEEMQLYITKGMNDGALGMSTGLIYLPGTFAKTDELVDLSKQSRNTEVFTSAICGARALIFSRRWMRCVASARSQIACAYFPFETCWATDGGGITHCWPGSMPPEGRAPVDA